jgi:hypothetical protein
VSVDELKMDKYLPDSAAAAVVLYDIGKSYFEDTDNNFILVFERATRIKILKTPGIKWTQINVLYYTASKDESDEVCDIEAFSYNLDNSGLRKTKLEPANIYVEKINNYWSAVKFAVPDVQEGSVIEYRYKVRKHNPGFLNDWEFQWKIPVVYSEYETRMIPFYEYKWLLQGATKFDNQYSYISKDLSRRFGSIEYQDMIHKFIMKDIPAFYSEKFITAISDYIIKIDFQLDKIHTPNGGIINVLTSWEEINNDMLKNQDFGSYLKKAEQYKADSLITALKANTVSKRELFNKIIEYVKTNYCWDKHYGYLSSKSFSQFLRERRGNCADINLFATGLLRRAGIEAEPVLISTRNNGKIKYNYAYINFFNYLLIAVKIDDKYYLSDATEPLLDNERIPEMCLNDRGLLVNKKVAGWINLESNIPTENRTSLEIEVEPISYKASCVNEISEYEAFRNRKELADGSIKAKELLPEGRDDIDLTTFEVLNQADKTKPLIIKYRLKGRPNLLNGKIFINPFLELARHISPLTEGIRTYPVDFISPFKYSYSVTIKYPEGYKPEYIPEKLNITNNYFEMHYNPEISGNTIKIDFSYYFKRSVYSPENYMVLKIYFNEIAKKSADRLIIAN